MTRITLEDATRITMAAVEHAQELQVRVAVAVYDVELRLVTFARMDGALLAGSAGAHGKAMLSAAFGASSGDLAPLTGSALLSGLQAAEGGYYVPVAGAVPLYRDGVLVGALGVGGATPDTDEDCAKAGAALL